MQLRLALCLIGVLVGPLVAAGDIHKWVDAQGNVHFSDRAPENVQSQVVTVKPNVYVTPTVERLDPKVASSDPVVLYSTSWCGYCKQARQYFATKRIPFSEYDVETTAKGRADYSRLGMRGVPVILVGASRLNGFSPESFDRLYAGQGR